MPQQQYRLRLGEGTMLLVDRDALNTWLVDDRAMVQPVGAKRWRSLRQFIADEKEAAFYAPAPVATAATPAANEPPRSTRLEDVLVPAPPKTKPAAAPVIPVEEPSLQLPIDPQAALALEPPPALNEPLRVTNVAFAPVEEEPAPPVALAVSAPEPPALDIQVEEPPAPVQNLFSSLQTVAATTLEPPPIAAAPAPIPAEKPIVVQPRQEEAVWTPPAPEPEPPPLTEDELELTRPRMTLQEYGRPEVAAPPAKTAARKEPGQWQPQAPVERGPDPAAELPPPEPVWSPPPASPLQVLADETKGGGAYGGIADDEAPLIALKPLDDEPVRPSIEVGERRDDMFVTTPRPNVVEAATTMVKAWGGLIHGWVDALDRRKPGPRPPAPAIDPLELEPLDSADAVVPTSASVSVSPLASARGRAAAIGAGVAGAMTSAAGVLSQWLQSLRRDRATLSLGLPSPPERRAPEPELPLLALDEDFSEQAPAPRAGRPVASAPRTPPAVPPPSINDMPVIRLAPLAPAAEETEDVYESDDDGTSVFDVAGTWAKRLVLTAVAAAAVFVAAITWETWLPKAGGLGVKVVGEIENRVNPAEDAMASALGRATQALPHLSAEMVALILARRGPVEPAVVFQTAHDAAARGLSALSAAEAQELAFLRRELASTLSPLEQVRLRDFDRVRSVVPSAEEDSVIALVAQGVANLSPPRQERLQILTSKAVAAGLADPVASNVGPAASSAAGR